MGNIFPSTHAESATILAIFWALARLTEQRQNDPKKYHTVKSIQDVINNPKLNRDTVSKWCDFLEKFGAIVCNYKSVERKGKRHILYELFPEKIPPMVYKRRLPPSTATRYKQAMTEQGIARYFEGNLHLDMDGLNHLMNRNFAEFVKDAFEKSNGGNEFISSVDDFDTWVLEEINGTEVKISADSLEIFHHWVCLWVASMKS